MDSGFFALSTSVCTHMRLILRICSWLAEVASLSLSNRGAAPFVVGSVGVLVL